MNCKGGEEREREGERENMSERRLKVARVNEFMPIGVSEREEKEDR